MRICTQILATSSGGYVSSTDHAAKSQPPLYAMINPEQTDTVDDIFDIYEAEFESQQTINSPTRETSHLLKVLEILR